MTARPDDRSPDETHHSPAPGEVPNEQEVAEEFPHGSDRPLKEQRPLHDADGDDIRQYTGEPVETEHGTVIPQQSVVGSQRVVGGGEFPNTPGRADDDAEDRGVDRDDRDDEGFVEEDLIDDDAG